MIGIGKFNSWEDLENKMKELGFDCWQKYTGEFEESDMVEIMGFKDFTEKNCGLRPAQREAAWQLVRSIENREDINILYHGIENLHNWDTRAEILLKI